LIFLYDRFTGLAGRTSVVQPAVRQDRRRGAEQPEKRLAFCCYLEDFKSVGKFMAGLQPMASDDPKIDIEAYKQRHQKIEILSCASLIK
jgi:hypothetical protein